MTNPIPKMWAALIQWCSARRRRDVRVNAPIPKDWRNWSQDHVDMSKSRYR